MALVVMLGKGVEETDKMHGGDKNRPLRYLQTVVGEASRWV